MARIHVISSDRHAIEEGSRRLRRLHHSVRAEAVDPDVLRTLRADPPDAFVIDISRAPARGRDLAIAFRKWKETRSSVLLFVGGEPAKVAEIKKLLPDATFSSWVDLETPLKLALANPPEEPVVPASLFAAYAERSAAEKLGIVEGSVVALIDAPDGIERSLGELPPGVELRRTNEGRADLALWFVSSKSALQGNLARMRPRSKRSPLWIAWPKKSSGVESDLTQTIVRRTAMDAGLVDYKICSIDSTWSALVFTFRGP